MQIKFNEEDNIILAYDQILFEIEPEYDFKVKTYMVMNIPDQDTDYNIIGLLNNRQIIIYETNHGKTLGFYDKRERRRLKKIFLPEIITCFSISEDEKIIGYVDEANQGWAIYVDDWQRAIIALKNE